MQKTTNYGMNIPEWNEQFNLDNWNDNTIKTDTVMALNRSDINKNRDAIELIMDNLTSGNPKDTSSIYYKLMLLAHPVQSLYWTSNPTNPSEYFGGSWIQIKDKFVLACGDIYTNQGASGGKSSVTLTTNNIPSHSHTFTPSGSITMNAHTHTLESHTHKFTPSGNVTSTFTGTNQTGSVNTESGRGDPQASGVFSASDLPDRDVGDDAGSYHNQYQLKFSMTPSGSVASTFIGIEQSTTSSSGSINSTTSTGSFTGSAGNTGSVGSGTAFSIMPPYVVKYCLERIS